MDSIEINLVELNSLIQELRALNDNGETIYSKYGQAVENALVDAMGYEKTEAINHLSLLRQMMLKLNLLIGNTATALEAAREKYISSDESLAAQYSVTK